MISSYQSTIDFLFNQLPVFERTGATAYKPGLATVENLSAAFGNPHKRLKRVIHIAGTNGKGSTAHSLAAILQSAGYRTGLFTSPHLVDFRERMRIDGRMIGKEEVVDFVDKYRTMQLNLTPSFFELTTVMAFDWFARIDVDVAVIEVGLGGRLDSTNIVSPDLCVITNISYDHTNLLGNTLTEIAAEKAGIIKPRVPVIIGESEGDVRRVFEEKAREMKAPIVFADDNPEVVSVTKTGDKITYETRSFERITSGLAGDYQRKNMSTILSAVKLLRSLGLALPDEAVGRGLEAVEQLTGLSGRWTVLSREPLTVCDTGHNPGGWEWLCGQIDCLPGKKRIVVGFVADKDVDEILGMMSREIHNASFYFTAPSNHRRLASEELRDMADSRGVAGECFTTVGEAYEKALADSGKGDSLFIGGSNYVVAELFDFIGRR